MYPINQSPEADFLRKHFAEYYLKHKIDSVPEVEKREFGFGVFKRKIANRNMSFSSLDEMNLFLREKVPLFFSYSNACYKYPAKSPMSSKELIKADIIYEFDADELGVKVEEIDGYQWFHKTHLDAAKKEVFKILDFLHDDLNFSEEGIAINFSGKAGYHVHLRGKEVQELTKQARIEIVDFLTAHNMDFNALGFNLSPKALSCPKGKGAWQKRLNAGLKTLFAKDQAEVALLTGYPKKKLDPLFKSKEDLLRSIEKGVLFPLGRSTEDFWTKALEAVAASQKSLLDRQTSIDLHKIIRVPATLHGDTGMVAKVVSLKELADFNPFDDAIVFWDEKVRVFIKKAPKFSLKGTSFGPYENETIEVPLFCAVYLIGKGAVLK